MQVCPGDGAGCSGNGCETGCLRFPAKLATTASLICGRAADLTGGDRAKTHGDKVENHNNIATLWSAFLGVPISAQQVALMMVLLKVARTKAGAHNPDDYVDMAGYSGVSGEIAGRTPVEPQYTDDPDSWFTRHDRIIPKGRT